MEPQPAEEGSCHGCEGTRGGCEGLTRDPDGVWRPLQVHSWDHTAELTEYLNAGTQGTPDSSEPQQPRSGLSALPVEPSGQSRALCRLLADLACAPYMARRQ